MRRILIGMLVAVLIPFAWVACSASKILPQPEHLHQLEYWVNTPVPELWKQEFQANEPARRTAVEQTSRATHASKPSVPEGSHVWPQRLVLVTDEAGNPLADSQARNSSHPGYPARSRSKPGNIELQVPPGAFDIEAVAMGYQPARVQGESWPESGPLVIRLKPFNAKPFTVKVDWAKPGPAPGAKLAFRIDGHDGLRFTSPEREQHQWVFERDFGAETEFEVQAGVDWKFRVGAPEWLFIVVSSPDPSTGRGEWQVRAEPRAIVRTRLVRPNGDDANFGASGNPLTIRFAPLDNCPPGYTNATRGDWLHDRLEVTAGEPARMPPGRYFVWSVETDDHERGPMLAAREMEFPHGRTDLTLVFDRPRAEPFTITGPVACTMPGAVFMPANGTLANHTAAAESAGNMSVSILLDNMRVDTPDNRRRIAGSFARGFWYSAATGTTTPGIPVVKQGMVWLPVIEAADWHVMSACGTVICRAVLDRKRGTVTLSSPASHGNLKVQGRLESLERRTATTDGPPGLTGTREESCQYVLHLWTLPDPGRTIWEKYPAWEAAGKPDHVIVLAESALPSGAWATGDVNWRSDSAILPVSQSIPAGKYRAQVSRLVTRKAWQGRQFADEPNWLFQEWRDSSGHQSSKTHSGDRVTWVVRKVMPLSRGTTDFELTPGGRAVIDLDALLDAKR